MTYSTSIINPFYAGRCKRITPAPRPEPEPCRKPERPVYAKLPRAPINASPVPHLTSLYHFHRAGEYGDRKWPGNCGGNLIKDLSQLLSAEIRHGPNAWFRHVRGRMP